MFDVDKFIILFASICAYYVCNSDHCDHHLAGKYQANYAPTTKLDFDLHDQGIIGSYTLCLSHSQDECLQWKLTNSLAVITNIKCGQLLTQDGYAELTSIQRLQIGKCKFVKQKLNYFFLFLTILHTCFICVDFKTFHVINYLVLAQYLSNTEKVGLGLYNYYLIVHYLLLRGGVESNPGPPKRSSTDEGLSKKRVRKSGKTYCAYLTEREPLENAPKYMQKEINSICNDEQQETHLRKQSEVVIRTADDDQCTLPATDVEIIPEDQAAYEQPDTLFMDSPKRLEVEDKDKLIGTSSYKFNTYSISDENFSDSDISDSEPNLTPPTTDSSDEGSSCGDIFNSDCFEVDTDLKDVPVYEGARISTGASMLLHITFALQENLTGNGLCKLLNLTEIHCKENNTIPTSLHIFKKWFKNLKIPPKKHMYCSSCLYSIDNSMQECPNQACRSSLSKQANRSYFVEIPLIEQIHKLFFNKSFRENILFRFKREKKKRDNIEDIYDGKLYKSLEHFLSDANNISLMWNTDGIPLFKSSNISMWPLYFAINELPFKVRRNPENLLLPGLWIGPKKPQMLTFLKPFIDDLLLLENGTKVNTDDGQSLIVKGILIAGTADLPAKCAVCNMVQYNGKYSCPHCKQPGKTAVSGKGRCHIFPFDYDNATGPKRSHNETLEMVDTASATGNPVFGIKGPCWFTTLRSYDFVIGNCTDYMHCVLLGVTKRLTTFWFSKDFSGKEYNFYNSIGIINERISHLKPPLTIHRMPRSIDDLRHWKASEFRSWLLFYAPVLLSDILSPGHYKHFLLFSNAIYLLLKESISQAEIIAAENYLELFVMQFSNLYEERFMTLNIHLLLHLSENVRQLGPLWTYSCFPFEDANGYLLKLIKGTQMVESQITDTLAIVHGVPFLEHECIGQGSAEEELLKKMKNLSCGTEKQLQEGIYSLGKGLVKEPHQLSPEYFVSLSNFLKKPLNGNVTLFKRIMKGNKIYHSLEYTRAKVRNSYTIKYISHGLDMTDGVCFGVVKTFAQYVESNTKLKKNVAILLPLKEIENERDEFPFDEITEQRLMSHFATFQSINYMALNYVVTEMKDILDICIMMHSDNNAKIHVCCAPNLLEKD